MFVLLLSSVILDDLRMMAFIVLLLPVILDDLRTMVFVALLLPDTPIVCWDGIAAAVPCVV